MHNGMELASLEGDLVWWLSTSMQYLLAGLLEAWASPQDWSSVSGIPNMVDKALQVVGETLEKQSSSGSDRDHRLGVSYSFVNWMEEEGLYFQRQGS